MALIMCPDCGREISDLAPACVGCGRPRPTTEQQPASTGDAATDTRSMYGDRSRRLIWAAMILGTAVTAIVFGMRAVDRWAEADAEQQRRGAIDVAETGWLDERLNNSKGPVAEPEPRPSSPQDARYAAAAQAWANFDRLPAGPTFRTAAMLRSHLLLANQTAEGLPSDEKTAIVEYNAREYRSRLPVVLVVGEVGEAEGDDLRVVVPSRDAARCSQLANAWLKDGIAESLGEAGFTSIRCDSSPPVRDKTWRVPKQN